MFLVFLAAIGSSFIPGCVVGAISVPPGGPPLSCIDILHGWPFSSPPGFLADVCARAGLIVGGKMACSSSYSAINQAGATAHPQPRYAELRPHSYGRNMVAGRRWAQTSTHSGLLRSRQHAITPHLPVSPRKRCSKARRRAQGVATANMG